LLILAVLIVTASNLYAAHILVSAAMSLKDAFTEIARDFEKKYPQEKVHMNFASSGQLQKQIEEGAQADVFASASVKELNSLEEKGLIINTTRRTFAQNSLIILSHKKITDIKDLAKGEFGKIAIGDPGTVPAGKYAKETLEHYKMYAKLKDKFIFAENVRQVLAYVVRNEVDAGIVYKTDALTVKDPSLLILTIDAKSHEKIEYPMAVIKQTQKENTAKLFVDFVGSKTSRAILKKYGFYIP
ncbi:MAG: molybdate transport system substrate-binding protein, partial [Euryarchaeota archaeon]|nr:molybdate transport system substrate-binding protein [Euryarchaeota archaeon]